MSNRTLSLISFFSSNTKLSKVNGNNIDIRNFEEIRNYIEYLCLTLPPEIKEYEHFFESIVNAISNQIFDFLKIPILYSSNQICREENTIISQISKMKIISSVFSHYEEIERLLNLLLDQFLDYFTKQFLNFLRDKNDLYLKFHITGIPVKIDWPIGDFHNKGNTHSIMTFSCGAKIVYKTKDCGTNLIIEDFIEQIAQNGYSLPFIFPKRIIKSCYYWEEFVEYETSDNSDVIKSYYKILGKYLSFFYVLGVSDIIRDNIIVKKGTPVFIDFECILKPVLKFSKIDTFAHIRSILYDSVVGTGLLPFWTPKFANAPGINYGGIGNEELYNQYIQLQFCDDGTMVFEYRKKYIKSTHIPYQNKKLSIRLFYYDLIEGFRDACHYVLHNKKWIKSIIPELIQKYNPNSRFLMRHTSVYTTLLQESLHPSYLKSKKSRMKFLSYLNDSYDSDFFPTELIEIEKKSLINLDIPIFYVKPLTTEIFYEDKKFSIIQESGIKSVERRINSLSKSMIDFQANLIGKSIACFEDISEPVTNKPITRNFKDTECEIKTNTIQTHIIKIAESIIKNSIFINDSYQWIDITVGKAGQWELAPQGPGLYDGIDGIGLFYLYLYKVFNIEKYKLVSRSLLENSLLAFKNFDATKSYYLFSPFSFPFSTLYFLWHYQYVTNENIVDIDKLMEEKLVPFVTNHIDSENNFDFMNGAAGLLSFLVDYHSNNKLQSIEECVHLLYQHIIKSAKFSKDGVSWESEKFRNLVGFAHGNAGFLMAISKYYKQFGYTKENLNFLENIIKYNNCKFSNTIQNWQDLRYQDKRTVFPSWCHGASGIALSYLFSMQLLNLRIDSIDWNHITTLIIKEGLENQHCICHGMLGNAEAIITISKYMNNIGHINTVKKKIFNEVKKNNNGLTWQTGFTNGSYHLRGLFMGITGIGYELLKIFCDEDIPSFLLLDPPSPRKTYNT